MNSKRNEIIKFIKQGISIPKISKKLNVNKSTIYYHYKKIKGRKFPLGIIPVEDKVIGEFLGAFAGDGSYYHDKKRGHHNIRFHLHANDDKEYGLFLKKLIENNFQKKVRFYIHKDRNELTLGFYSKKISDFIKLYLTIQGYKTLNVSLKKPIDTFSKQFLKSFIRGLFDTDGHAKKDGRLVLCLISKKLIKQVSKILIKFGIDNKIYLRKKGLKSRYMRYELTIPRRYLNKYLMTIGFSNHRKNAMTGNRTQV